MPRARTLLLVRHGETAWNKEGRYQGQSDIPLNDVGRGQARALRARLFGDAAHGHLFDAARTAVATSDLARARETAEIAFAIELGEAGAAAPRELHVDAGLREVRYGVFEGKTPHEIDEAYPGLFAEWVSAPAEFAMPEGESRLVVRARAALAVRTFAARVPDAIETLVVVAHGGVLRQLLRLCFEDDEPTRGLNYANAVVHAVRVDAHDTEATPAWRYLGELT